MEVSDELLFQNRDWDPCYLRDVMSTDFYDFNELWGSNVHNLELIKETNRVENYCPLVEDITLDDYELSVAVDKIEEEYVFYFVLFIFFQF